MCPEHVIAMLLFIMSPLGCSVGVGLAVLGVGASGLMLFYEIHDEVNLLLICMCITCFGVCDSGFRGLGSRVWGWGFRVWGLGFRGLGPLGLVRETKACTGYEASKS